MSTQIRRRTVQTPRLKVHIREAGSGPVPIVLLHGNCSSSVFYEDLMLALGDEYHTIAPDLRGYGDTEPLPVDATRGCGDWADDLAALVDTLGLDRFHLAGWSMGGGGASTTPWRPSTTTWPASPTSRPSRPCSGFAVTATRSSATLRCSTSPTSDSSGPCRDGRAPRPVRRSR